MQAVQYVMGQEGLTSASCITTGKLLSLFKPVSHLQYDDRNSTNIEIVVRIKGENK